MKCKYCNSEMKHENGRLYTQRCENCGYYYVINPLGYPAILREEGFRGVLKTEIIDIHKKKGRRPEFEVYCGREIGYRTKHTRDLKEYWYEDSKWSNPFSIKKYGKKSLALFADFISKKIEEYPEIYKISELLGKRLGCWCRNKRDFCHLQILLKILKKKYKKSFFVNKWTLITPEERK